MSSPRTLLDARRDVQRGGADFRSGVPIEHPPQDADLALWCNGRAQARSVGHPIPPPPPRRRARLGRRPQPAPVPPASTPDFARGVADYRAGVPIETPPAGVDLALWSLGRAHARRGQRQPAPPPPPTPPTPTGAQR